MIDEEPKAELPIGEAKKLGELTQEKWREHLLLFSQVKNEVLEVNPHVHMPMKLEEGKSSPLGLFVEAAFRERPRELPRGKHALEVWPKMHRRSALLGRVIFADKEGWIYRDIDLKGIGYVFSTKFEKGAIVLLPGRVIEERRAGSGLLNCDSAFFERQASEKFLLAGIRTYRVLAIIELKELIVNRRKLSQQKAIEENIIDENFRPVVEIRAFGTKARIYDLDPEFNPDKEDRKLLLEDAKRLVSQELGRKETISEEGYLEWFAKTLGYNVGLMHKNGWFHDSLTDHNITLDCRICDLDTIAQLTNKIEQNRDIGKARYSLNYLLKFLGLESTKWEPFERQFQESYDKVFPPEEREKYFNRF